MCFILQLKMYILIPLLQGDEKEKELEKEPEEKKEKEPEDK